MAESADAGAVKILAIIVLYQLRPGDAVAYCTLQTARALLGHESESVQILLYDNSPSPGSCVDLPPEVRYHAANRNEGIAAAYNFALDIALRENYDWLLTLDQDTAVPPDILVSLRQIAARFDPVNEIGAIVSQLIQEPHVLSPVYLVWHGVRRTRRGQTGVVREETHAYNSGSLFRVRALRQIGGFHPWFWLDYQDAYIYRQLHRHGRRVYIAGNLQLQHDLSLLARKKGLNPDRYSNYLQAESAFCDLYESRFRRGLLTLRLLGRLARQKWWGADPCIRKLTQHALRQRLLLSRRCRIEIWQNQMRQMFPSSSPNRRIAGERPRVSVCMAAYNGQRFIVDQLRSILAQLSEQDEVIVVDDASQDGTRDCITALNDSRIHLHRHRTNLGVLRTFEDAIRAASGDILFLSDQDDLWQPSKVAKTLVALDANPGVTLIATDTALIDEDGRMISESFFAGRGRFRSGLWANLARNRFGGCTMAFRAEIISDILPLPRRRHVLHDIWIGVRNSLSGHRSFYIDEPLVLNRRHSTNTTGNSKLGFLYRLRIRIDFLLALLEFRIQRGKSATGIDR